MMPTRSVYAHTGVFARSALVLLFLVGCSGNNDPFSYARVSGTVTYDDGSIIPANKMKVSFHSESPPAGNKYPRPGWALVDEKTGKFGCPTSHTAFDGLVRGKHKVVITTADSSQGPLPANLVPPEYADPNKTPLEVDTDNSGSFNLKVHKPKAGAGKSASPVSPSHSHAG
jgi:hypothetical protein